ncbi:ParB/RepB/Spo0J family partition protein [Paraburkholderia aspalathi]|uniref:ParB/RepB/Spo0J family partition protein n=1 Tax=Paraburkholderia aspalathi TaxID=1324617 RepID=UPI001B0763DA|nr:ParB N-terminal domain-containing protein [Paraburkholderia aspalathi]CAE6846773.1 Nucleoid occlusion protein [Paraburkholderia aspalathi]
MQFRNGQQLTSLAQLSKMKPGSAMAAAIEEATGAMTMEILVSRIITKPQDRLDFKDIEAFAARLKVVGHVHTAILVRATDGDDYELIGGERRVRGSILNGWEKIPAKIFPANTPDLAIRMYQVSENVDRKSLSAKETALGLASDIDRFGREEAARLWTNPKGKQRSESWISKHLRFRKYGPVTRELFDAGLFDDVEAANKMDDIEAENADLASEMADAMRAGERFGRLTLDARLAQIRSASRDIPPQDGPSTPAAAEQEPVPLPSVRTPPSNPNSTDGEGSGPSAAHIEQAGGPAIRQEPAPSVTQAVQLASQAQKAPRDAAAALRPKQERAGSTDPMRTVIWRVEELFHESTGSIHRLRQLQADLAAAGVGGEDADWRLWVAFVQLACSALVGVGQPRAEQMINRLSAELNSRSAIELLNALHPSRKAGVLPDDFRYDTEREIHPLAPNNWAL